MANITKATLDDATKEGRYAVGQLKYDHEQEGCVTVPGGTRFVVKGIRGGDVAALFPHDAIPEEERVFSNGHIRIVPLFQFDVVGRIN